MNTNSASSSSGHETMTIQSLFLSGQAIRIPAYQRAYSWEEKHCKQFLDDLNEQSGKKYYLGQFLFERENKTFLIIDGQQRLTTTILYLSAISKLLVEKGEDISPIKNIYLTDIFKTIDEDQYQFERITRKFLSDENQSFDTLSQKRLLNAFNLFMNALSNLSVIELKALQTTLAEAVIYSVFIPNKVEATQVFEYQNNRGKELSRFEIIKAYLMHQVYICTSDFDHASLIIGEIQKCVTRIYRSLEVVEGYFTENELLDCCCKLYYNSAGRVEDVKSVFGREKNNRAEWPKNFFDNFLEICESARNIVNNKNQIKINNLFFLGNEANWKYVLIAIHIKGQQASDKYGRILKLLEVLSFKLKLGDYRTNYLPDNSRSYFNDESTIDNLYQQIRLAVESGFKWYWNDGNKFSNLIKIYFDGKYHYHHHIIKYILWQYENQLRIVNKSGSLMDMDLYEDYTIEHIKPQNPLNQKHTEDFIKNYLHLAGNLALLTSKQNSKFGNKSFEDKCELFQDTALSSYTEIRSKDQWTEIEILERHNKISDFASKYFDISNL